MIEAMGKSGREEERKRAREHSAHGRVCNVREQTSAFTQTAARSATSQPEPRAQTLAAPWLNGLQIYEYMYK